MKHLFDGRARRSELWGATIIVWLGALLVAWLVVGNRDSLIASAALSLGSMALVAPMAVRRLHDRDRPAWQIWPLWVLPQLLGFTRDAPNLPMLLYLPLLVAAVGVLALGVWGFVELYLLPGTVGENRYGPDRKAAIPA